MSDISDESPQSKTAIKGGNPAEAMKSSGNALSDSEKFSQDSELLNVKPLEGDDLIDYIKKHSNRPQGIEIPKMGNNTPHAKIYYSLAEASNVIGANGNVKCTSDDLLHFGGIGKIRLVTVVPAGVRLYLGDNHMEYIGIPLLLPNLLVVHASYCRQIECCKETEQSDFNDGFLIDPRGNVHPLPPNNDRFDRTVWRTGDKKCEPKIIELTPERLFVLSFDLATFLEGKFPQQLESSIEQAKPIDKRSKRRISEREEILLASIYLKEKWATDCLFKSGQKKEGQTNATAWAKLLEEKSPLFWPDTGKPPQSGDEIQRLLRDALTYGDKTK